MSKKLITLLVISGIVSLASYIGYYFYTNYYLPSRHALPSPLDNIEFPSEPTQYPADWPEDLKFSEDFVLVDSTSGTLPESTTKGWSAKLRFNGKPTAALQATTRYFETNNWTIIEKSTLDSGGYSLLLQRGSGQGIIVIDTNPDNSSTTLVVATFFP